MSYPLLRSAHDIEAGCGTSKRIAGEAARMFRGTLISHFAPLARKDLSKRYPGLEGPCARRYFGRHRCWFHRAASSRTETLVMGISDREDRAMSSGGNREFPQEEWEPRKGRGRS